MAVTTSDLLLEATGVAKTYGAVVALRSASLSVRPGEVHALMGANGAGKSTLVKILSGAVRPDAGTIAIRGRELAVRSPWRSPPRRHRLRLPGAGPHPRPRHPVEPAADRDRGRAVPPLVQRAGHERPGARQPGAAAPPRHVADHRPGARAGHRARRADARRDDRGPAREPHRARARGRRPPAGRRALHHLHLPPDDRDRRGLRPGDGPARRARRSASWTSRPAPRTASSSSCSARSSTGCRPPGSAARPPRAPRTRSRGSRLAASRWAPSSRTSRSRSTRARSSASSRSRARARTSCSTSSPAAIARPAATSPSTASRCPSGIPGTPSARAWCTSPPIARTRC